MTIIEISLLLFTGYATGWALYLLILPIAAALPGCRVKGAEKTIVRWPRMVVIVPAANAAHVIRRCVQSLRACSYPTGTVEFYVVADHCSDNTAEEAQLAGATVLIRSEGPRGKTYTIAWALSSLKLSQTP